MAFKLFTQLLIHHTDTVVSEIDGDEPNVPHSLDCFDSTAAKTDFVEYFTNVSAACRMFAISEASHASCVWSRAWHSMMLNRRTWQSNRLYGLMADSMFVPWSVTNTTLFWHTFAYYFCSSLIYSLFSLILLLRKHSCSCLHFAQFKRPCCKMSDSHVA